MSSLRQHVIRLVQTGHRGEEGMALIMALIALALGALIITPTLNYMATGIKSTAINQEHTARLYAADAGVEYAIWKMKEDQVSPYPRSYELADINGYSVSIAMVRYNKEIYHITSVSGGTTIDAYTEPPDCKYFPGDQNFDKYTMLEGNVYIDGNATIGQGSQVTGHLYVVGDLNLNQCNRVAGNIYATGSIQIDRFPGHNINIGGSIYAGVDLAIDRDVTVQGDIYAVGNIDLDQDVVIQGMACAGGTVTYNPAKTEIWLGVNEGWPGPWPPPPDFVDDRHKLISYQIH